VVKEGLRFKVYGGGMKVLGIGEYG